MDTRIKVQQIIPMFSCGADIVSSDHENIVAERVIDISDEELMRLGKRFLELIDQPNENLTFTREELVKWLWKIVHNNSDNDFGKWCEELIDRLDGFERFVVETREWGE